MRYHAFVVIEIFVLVLLLVVAVALLSIAGSVGRLVEIYHAPPLDVGDIVWIRSFGNESRCVVRAVEGNVVVVDHFPET